MRRYSHLSDDEREQIGLAKAVGHSISAIAKAIGRPKSTVSRELLRNRLPSGRYSPLHAAGAYQLRGTRIVSAGGDDGIVRLWTFRRHGGAAVQRKQRERRLFDKDRQAKPSGSVENDMPYIGRPAALKLLGAGTGDVARAAFEEIASRQSAERSLNSVHC